MNPADFNAVVESVELTTKLIMEGASDQNVMADLRPLRVVMYRVDSSSGVTARSLKDFLGQLESESRGDKRREIFL